MAMRLRQLLLLLTVCTLSMQSLRPAMAMNCGCKPISQSQSGGPSAPSKCQCNPSSESCCCSSAKPMDSADSSSVRCSCSHDDVPPAIPPTTTNAIPNLELGLPDEALLVESVSFRNLLQGCSPTAQCIGDPHPRRYAQLCFNHWLI